MKNFKVLVKRTETYQRHNWDYYLFHTMEEAEAFIQKSKDFIFTDYDFETTEVDIEVSDDTTIVYLERHGKDLWQIHKYITYYTVVDEEYYNQYNRNKPLIKVSRLAD